ncbi:hypothetical protein PG994_014369 [Apiospora phragmitis]|uniref:Uncharacterized protein n=1 Tax=Apiospora phragmitis TaxID=2905665 RepID=A0ABR1T4L5_9PEZI
MKDVTSIHVVNCAPKGWPALASQQMFYPNAGIHRKFSNLMQRILVNFQLELDCVDQKFLELDKADERYGILGFLPFDRDEFIDRCCGVERQQQQRQQQQQQNRLRAAIDQQYQHEQRARHKTPDQHHHQIQPTATDQQARPRTAPEQRVQQTSPKETVQPTTPIQQNKRTVSTQGNETSPDMGHMEERAHLMDSAKSIFKEYRT